MMKCGQQNVSNIPANKLFCFITKTRSRGSIDRKQSSFQIVSTNQILAVFNEIAIPILILPYRLFRPTSCRPVFSLLQLSLDCWSKPRQVVLHQIILRARTHSINCNLLANSAGDNDKRNVDISFLENGQCGGS